GPFRGDAELGPDAGPQALAAPAELVCHAVAPCPPPADERPPPGMGDLRIDRRAGAQPPAEDFRGDREPLVPRWGRAQPVPGSSGVGAPDIGEGYHRPGEPGRSTEHRSRRDRP